MTGPVVSAFPLLDAFVIGAVVVTALVAVLVPGRAAATTVFLVFGILLAVLWGRADAPDVAIAEVALGGGIAGAILVDALDRRRPPQPQRRPLSYGVVAISALAGSGALVALLLAMRSVSPEPAPLSEQALDALDASGVSHPVTAVLLNYRSLDTLLEIAVLVVASAAAGAVASGPTRRARSTDPVMRALAVVIVPIIVAVAIWVLVAGSTQPGGAFQSGALLGAALVVAHLCGLPVAAPRGRSVAVVAGGSLVAFVMLGLVGRAATGAWFGLDVAWAGAAILAIETVLAIGIAVALAGIFFAAHDADAESRAANVTEGAS